MEPKKKISKKAQDKIVKTTNTGAIPKNIGHSQMSGVTLNLETGKYE